MTDTRSRPSDRSTGGGLLDRVRAVRSRVRSTRTGRITWRVVVTVLGAAIVAGGILLLPLPGPGWLVIFAGLGVLATEYEWASKLLHFARRQVKSWTDWVAHQSRPVQALVGAIGLVFLAGVALLVWWWMHR